MKNAALLVDGYKTSHVFQYPEGTEIVYSNYTARKSRLEGVDEIVFFGLQYWIKKYLLEIWDETFFSRPKEEVISEIKQELDLYCPLPDYSHFEKLHDLGYLPVEIRAVDEGTRVPIGLPCMTIHNTLPEFYWVTNMLETNLSNILWMAINSATIANEYRKEFDKYAEVTCENKELVPFQGHDFSYRGMAGQEAAEISGAAHLTSFSGTDTIPAVIMLRNYYGAEGFVAGSVPACYDEKTEVLTEKGFVRFSDLDEGIKVAQYTENGLIEFVVPEKYYECDYEGELIRFSEDKIDLVVTPNHKMVRINNNGDSKKLELLEASEDWKYNGNYNLIVSGVAQGKEKSLSAMDKLRIAFQADGSFSSRSEEYNGSKTEVIPIRFSLKKQRKKDRLESILSEAELEYSVNHYENEYSSYRVQIPVIENFNKSFNWVDLSNKSAEWGQEFLEELTHWDGKKSRETSWTYSNSDLFSVEQVQAVAAIAGFRTKYNKYEDPRGDRKPQHSLNITKNTTLSVRESEKYPVTYSGKVYCVSVPTKMLVVRRNHCVAVCGNTEHSVMCAGGHETEVETFQRLLKTYPTGIVSVVSDTWDFWKVVTEYLPALKDKILSREGKLVIRPDCYDDQTEILTDSGWKFFKELQPQDLVYQVHDDGTGDFVLPSRIVRQKYSGDMIKFKDFHGKLDLLVTPNHRMVYEKNGSLKVQEAENYSGYHGKYFLRSAPLKFEGSSLSAMEALKIAFQADGSFQIGTNKKIRFSFSKVRKMERLEKILSKAGVDFQVYDLKDGQKEYSVSLHSDLFQKDLEWLGNIAEKGAKWCREFIEEVSYWDATRRHENRFKVDTTTKSVAQKIQQIALFAGYGCLMSHSEDQREEHFSDVYTLHILKNNKIGGQSVQAETVQYNGEVHCVTVPTGRIMVRRNRCTLVSGNSGCPVKIITGYTEDEITRVSGSHGAIICKETGKTLTNHEIKGLIQCLWDIFGGRTNGKDYKELDSHIGAIYGDAITLERQKQILSRLEKKGFASNNIVLGIGSFTYQYNTRDTHGGAVKATYCEINGEGINIFKDPKTDDGTKKSAKGLLRLNEDFTLSQEVSWKESEQGLIKLVFKDGKLIKESNISSIRQKLLGGKYHAV